jgi:hypothetical protein
MNGCRWWNLISAVVFAFLRSFDGRLACKGSYSFRRSRSELDADSPRYYPSLDCSFVVVTLVGLPSWRPHLLVRMQPDVKARDLGGSTSKRGTPGYYGA